MDVHTHAESGPAVALTKDERFDGASDETLAPEEDKRILRKIDWWCVCALLVVCRLVNLVIIIASCKHTGYREHGRALVF
ncbi:hypothetical protein E4U21_004967 [Claviceps maximensis]|nr:hypothetical protein E4U21_004967 [Claviceps maximensis]